MKHVLLILAVGLTGCQLIAPHPSSCTDGTLNGAETDVDCGGATCGACAVGKVCLASTDCVSGLCTVNRCAQRSCVDGVKNGDETDVDCGGSCPACAVSQGCSVASDCAGGDCVSGACVTATCADQRKNGGETDVDCGGPCPPCRDSSACLRNADCQSASCVDAVCGGASSCATPLKQCGNACVDPRVDPLHCGGCTTMCAPGQVCSGSACAAFCAGGTKDCGGGCVDVGSNPLHCGGCNQPCAPGQLCINGACTLSCPSGTVACGPECADTSRDALHCGNCPTSCAPGVACVNGMCTPGAGCQAPLTACPQGVCADLRNDPANCGACGVPCLADHAQVACAAMTCVLASCQPGFEDCDGQYPNGCEANLLSDNNHCGFCAHACTGGDSCSGGMCCGALPANLPATCQNCTACDGKLRCECDNGFGMFIPAIENLGCGVPYLNCGGTLRCGGGPC